MARYGISTRLAPSPTTRATTAATAPRPRQPARGRGVASFGPPGPDTGTLVIAVFTLVIRLAVVASFRASSPSSSSLSSGVT